ncbi:MAG: hypothetical protein ACRD5B_02080 [Nitrososphaeraceae archaeon]
MKQSTTIYSVLKDGKEKELDAALFLRLSRSYSNNLEKHDIAWMCSSGQY